VYNILIQLIVAFSMLVGKILFHTSFERFQIGSSDVQAFLNLKYPGVPVSLADGEYCYVDLDAWRNIFLRIAAFLKPYMRNFRDCDDFADFVKGIVAMMFAVNTCFRVSGTNANGQAHAYNLILYQEKGILKADLVESQSLTIGCSGYTVSTIRG